MTMNTVLNPYVTFVLEYRAYLYGETSLVLKFLLFHCQMIYQHANGKVLHSLSAIHTTMTINCLKLLLMEKECVSSLQIPMLTTKLSLQKIWTTKNSWALADILLLTKIIFYPVQQWSYTFLAMEAMETLSCKMASQWKLKIY